MAAPPRRVGGELRFVGSFGSLRRGNRRARGVFVGGKSGEESAPASTFGGCFEFQPDFLILSRFPTDSAVPVASPTLGAFRIGCFFRERVFKLICVLCISG